MALIYDVGMNNGDDTAFYLSRGHTVIAIEAIPDLVEAALNRFHDMSRVGRFRALNVAIAEDGSERDFWVCDDHSALSSVHRPLANRGGRKSHAIRVKSCRFRDVLDQFGLPHYLKIDIEGGDALCLQDLDRNDLPPFISVEAECGGDEVFSSRKDRSHSLSNLNHLYSCGYTRFKLVTQYSLVPISRSNLHLVIDSKYHASVREQIERDNRWRFTEASSGPWGNEIPGPWMTYSEAVEVFATCQELFSLHFKEAPSYFFWFDWHATMF